MHKQIVVNLYFLSLFLTQEYFSVSVKRAEVSPFKITCPAAQYVGL